MRREDYLGRVPLLLIMVVAMCWGLHYLPKQWTGNRWRRVDLLSDLRLKPVPAALDSLRLMLEQPDTLALDSVACIDSLQQTLGIDSVAMAVRDSLYRAMYADRDADSLGTHFEDYSLGHIGLKHFFDALRCMASGEQQRPVRVAFLGDSFIEGDILVADFRSALQRRFGGRGVGFIPINSVAARFRPTVELESTGWKTYSMLKDREQRYTLPCLSFEPAEERPTLHVKNTRHYTVSDTVSTLKFYYEENLSTTMYWSTATDVENGGVVQLPPTQTIACHEQKGLFTEANLQFADTAGFRALGVAMEDETGVVVDNFSLRGNSGMILSGLDSLRCTELNVVRPYDLIILQYGLNVTNDSILQYGWYTKRMEEVVHHLQNCFPQSDLLLLSVSDRSRQHDGVFETMPAVLALLHAQRQTARRTGIVFWNVFGAMGGENSMVRFVENNWASKDYTHLSFRGGREVASALIEALMKEKMFYDEADKHVVEDEEQ